MMRCPEEGQLGSPRLADRLELDLHRHMTDEVIPQLVSHGTHDAPPDELAEWYGGLRDGIVLTIPEDATSETFGSLVRRCKAIAPRA